MKLVNTGRFNVYASLRQCSLALLLAGGSQLAAAGFIGGVEVEDFVISGFSGGGTLTLTFDGGTGSDDILDELEVFDFEAVFSAPGDPDYTWNLFDDFFDITLFALEWKATSETEGSLQRLSLSASCDEFAAVDPLFAIGTVCPVGVASEYLGVEYDSVLSNVVEIIRVQSCTEETDLVPTFDEFGDPIEVDFDPVLGEVAVCTFPFESVAEATFPPEPVDNGGGSGVPVPGTLLLVAAGLGLLRRKRIV